MIDFTTDTFHNPEAAARHEWLETNGLGGSASSTILGMNTRRYHALLMAALPPPLGRVAMLSKLEETLRIGEGTLDLGCNQYPGAIHPQGHTYLRAFRLDPFPTFVYEVGGARLEKQIAMPHGQNAVIITYTLTGKPSHATLDLYPLLAFRDYHQTSHENPFVNGEATLGPDDRARTAPATWVRFALYDGLPALYLSAPSLQYEATGYWYRGFEYVREQERGLDFQEDLFNPGRVRVELTSGKPVHLVAALEPVDVKEAPKWLAAETKRRTAAVGPLQRDETAEVLARAADQFLICRPDGEATVIAGYPWFTDWGRDTMIALPGLTLPTGRYDEARAILRAFARSESEGMIPNRFPDGTGHPDYNTVDATLWMFVAAWHLLQATEDRAFAEREMLPVFTRILDWHQRGTRFGIQEDADGLLRAGIPGVQLTWMDAKIGDWVVTPRMGKPVEINALWYNARRIAAAIARAVDPKQAAAWEAAAEKTRDAFERRFWNEEYGFLADVVDTPEVAQDLSLRPNQIFAVSLPFPVLEGERARRVVNVVQERLFTPYGLRTLAPGDSRYRGQYGGDQWSRDSSYHQGPAWPWLLGGFWEAKLRVDGFSEAAKATVRAEMQPLLDHLADAGLGSISEIFDGDPPYRAAGCIAQAWSVAEPLRIWTLTAPARKGAKAPAKAGR